MLLKYIFLETGVHLLQDGLYIVEIAFGVNAQRMRNMNRYLDTGDNFQHNKRV